MELKRFFVSKIDDKLLAVEGEEFVHAVKVARLKTGFSFIGVNGDGNDYYCTVTAVHNASLTAKIDGTMPNLTEPKHALTLYFAVAKESDFIIRKGVELGIKRFVPFMSKRVNADFNRNRCEKIVREAVKQCERAVVPEIDGIIAFEELICRISNAPNTFFCYENHKGDSLLAALSRHIAARNAPADTVNLIVGCEGGFEDNEAAQIIAANATPVSLGARILKVETAVIAAVAIVNAVNEGCCSFVSGQL